MLGHQTKYRWWRLFWRMKIIILMRLDYCNSVLYDIADNLLQRLKSVQNEAARLVSDVRRRDHIAPILR